LPNRRDGHPAAQRPRKVHGPSLPCAQIAGAQDRDTLQDRREKGFRSLSLWTALHPEPRCFRYTISSILLWLLQFSADTFDLLIWKGNIQPGLLPWKGC